MKIFISGNPGVGKTTLVKKVYNLFPDIFIGFWTEEIRESGKRVGFKIVTTWGESYILATVYNRSKYRVGKYFVFPEILDKIIPKIEEKMYDYILLIDEIGKMEWYSDVFRSFIKKVLEDEKVDILATIHRSFLHLVRSYIWLEKDRWWEIYKNIVKKLENYGKVQGRG